MKKPVTAPQEKQLLKMKEKNTNMVENLKTHLSSCESLTDESSKVVKNCGDISLTVQEEFITLIDIALDEKLANMKDLASNFADVQEKCKKSLNRLNMCSQLAEEIKVVKSAV